MASAVHPIRIFVLGPSTRNTVECRLTVKSRSTLTPPAKSSSALILLPKMAISHYYIHAHSVEALRRFQQHVLALRRAAEDNQAAEWAWM